MSDKSEKEDRKAVYVSTVLYERIAERAKATGFDSVDDYVLFVLEEVVKDEDDETQAISEEDEEEVKKRLKSLGYME